MKPVTRLIFRRLLGICGIITLTACTQADLSDLKEFVAQTKAKSPPAKLDPLPEPEPYRPFTYTAQGLKDPFAPSSFAQETFAAAEPEPAPDSGIRPDPNRIREELEKYAIGSLKMVGTFRKQGEQQLWALVKAPDGIVHRVHEGNYVGTNHGKIVSITDQRIDLTEIVPDGENRWVERNAFLSLVE